MMPQASDLQFYPGTEYAYCPTCHSTCVPVFLECATGEVDIVCEKCLTEGTRLQSRDESETTSYVNQCTANGCKSYGINRCAVCDDPTCAAHLTQEGYCDDCRKYEQHYSKLSSYHY